MQIEKEKQDNKKEATNL